VKLLNNLISDFSSKIANPVLISELKLEFGDLLPDFLRKEYYDPLFSKLANRLLIVLFLFFYSSFTESNTLSDLFFGIFGGKLFLLLVSKIYC
jgi:hypothetical protein